MSPGKRDITIRATKIGDADEMSVILAEILTTWGSDRDICETGHWSVRG